MQDKCAKDSEAYFASEWSTVSGTTYIDHYNKTLNKCFIEVTIDTIGNSEMKDISLTDVQEKTLVGSMNVVYPVGQMPQTFTNCKVNNQKCTSLDEFNKLVSPYMNN